MLSKNTYIHFILNKKEKVKKLKIEELSIIEKKLNSIDNQYKKNKTLIHRANMLYLNGSIDDDCYNNRINQLKKDKLNIDNNKLNYINQINQIKQSIIILDERNKPYKFIFKQKNKRIKWFILDDNNEYQIDDIYGDSYVFINRF